MTVGIRVRRRPARAIGGVATVFVITVGWAARAGSQELTPRAYWPAPKGTRVAVVAYSSVAGDVLLDPSTPIYGADLEVQG